VLIALAERAGEVVSAEQLLVEVWHGSFDGDNPVLKTIAQLRRKLGDDSLQPHFIEPSASAATGCFQRWCFRTLTAVQ